jgi:MFS family permease
MASAAAPLALALWLNAVMLLATLSLLAVPILAPLLFADLGVPVETLGLYSGVLWGAALVGSLAAGSLIDRLGAWRAAQGALVVCAAGLLGGAGGAAGGLVLAAIAIGLANGVETPAASQLLARGVPPHHRPFYFSVKQTGVQIGGMAGALTLPIVAGAFGWRVALAAIAVLALALAAVLQWPGRRFAEPALPSGAPRIGIRAALGEVAAHPTLRRLALAAAAFGATQVCLNSFLVSFFVLERGATLAQAGLMLGVAQAGGLIGRLAWGWLAARHGDALRLLRLLGIAMALAAVLVGAWGATLPLALLLPLAFAFGLTASGWNGVFLAEIAELVPVANVASATGAVLVVMTIGLVASPPLFAAVGAAWSFGAGYVMLGAVAALGVVCLPRR